MSDDSHCHDGGEPAPRRKPPGGWPTRTEWLFYAACTIASAAMFAWAYYLSQGTPQ